jgi:hypothetical protein
MVACGGAAQFSILNSKLRDNGWRVATIMISEMFNHARECARYATNCQRCSGANCILSPLAPFQ